MAMDSTQAREKMVAEQLEARGISDVRVLEAMRTVPRDRFIPAELRDHAYDDGPLPIGADQTISQPYMVALTCEVAQLSAAARVLEVGTGSGYEAAVLSRLSPQVITVESLPHLYDRARILLQSGRA